MTLRAHILAACGLALLTCSAQGADLGQSADLVAVYQRALQNDPQIREADANRLASRESKPQALAALLPQINAIGIARDERVGWLAEPSQTSGLLDQVTIVNRDDKTTVDTNAYQYRAPADCISLGPMVRPEARGCARLRRRKRTITPRNRI